MQRAAFWKISVLALFTSIPVLADTNAAPEPGSDARAYVTFGMTNGREGKLDDAIAAFNQAIKLDPTFAPAYFNRAMAYDQKNSRALAMQDLNKTIELDPNFVDAYYQRGRMEGMDSDFDTSIKDFQKVIEINPKAVPAQYNLGHVFYFKGDLSKALNHLNEAIKIAPDYAAAYFIRGLVYRSQGHKIEMLSDFQKATGLNLGNASVWIWISQMEAGQKAQAQKDLSDAVASPNVLKPDEWITKIANFLLGTLTQDQLLQAVNTGSASELKDRQCQAWFYIGMSKRLAGDDAGATEAFNKSIAINSTSSEEFVEANREMGKSQPVK